MASKLPAGNHELTELRKNLESHWEVAAISQFISLFRDHFRLPEIEIEELEDGILEDTTKGSSVWLQNLIISFLRGIIVKNSVGIDNWESHLQRLLERKWVKREGRANPLTEGTSFSQLDIQSKVEIILSLCYFRLDRNDIQDKIMKTMHADNLRCRSLGTDDLGNVYWYFYGTRLYKEEPSKEKKMIDSWEQEWEKQKQESFGKRKRGRPSKKNINSDPKRGRPRKNNINSDHKSQTFDYKDNGYMNVDEKSRWSVVCNTIEEWVEFAEKFKTSKSPNEKGLFYTVQQNFLPALNEIYEEKEKKLRQKLRELVPRRIVTRRESQRQHMKTRQSSDNNGFSSDDAHKVHVARDRARRLEERNRRASEVLSVRRKSSRQDIEDYDDFYDIQTEHKPELDEYRRALLPVMSGDPTDLQTQMERLISEIKLHKDAWPFLYPVEECDAPGYYEIILEPMHLSEIERKLYENSYETIGQIDEDFSKMVANCQLYNGENSEYSIMVQTLWRMFRKGLSEILKSTQNVISSEETKVSCNVQQIQNSNIIRETSAGHASNMKRKRNHKLEALEMLADASKKALKNTYEDDMHEIKESAIQAQPNNISLKILPVHSHPSALIEKYTSDSSSHDSRDVDGSNDNSLSSFKSHDSSYESSSNEELYDFESGSKELSSASSIKYYMPNNINSNLANFVQKNNSNSFSMHKNEHNDTSISDVESEIHTNESNSSSDTANETLQKLTSDSIESIDNSISNILDEYNGANVTHFISKLMKDASYSSDIPSVPNNRESNTSFSSATQKCDTTSPKSSRKSPHSPGFINHTIADANVPFLPNRGNVQPELCSSEREITTVDASVLGISTSSRFVKKQAKTCSPVRNNGFAETQTLHDYKTQAQASKTNAHTAESPIISSHIPKLKSAFSNSAPNVQNQVQEVSSCGPSTLNVTSSSSFQYLNSNSLNTVSNMFGGNNAALPTQMTSSTVSNTSPQIPLQIPVTCAQAFIDGGNALFKPNVNNQISAMKVNIPPSTGQLLVLPGNSAPSTMTFHLFSQPNSTSSQSVEACRPMQGNEDASLVKMLCNQEMRGFNNQEKNIAFKRSNKAENVILHNKTLVPEQMQHVSSPPVPSRSSPSSFQHVSPKTFNDSDISNSLKSSHMPSSCTISSNSSIGKAESSRISVIQAGATSLSPSTPVVSLTSGTVLNGGPFTNSNSLQNPSAVFQNLCPKTTPAVFTSFNKQPGTNSANMGLGSSTNINSNAPSNVYFQNGMPFIQKVFIPNGSQPVHLSTFQNNGGQYLLNTNKSYNKSPSHGNQLNTFGNVVSDVSSTGPPILQVAKDNFVSSVPYQGVSQGFTQVTTNPQVMNIPAYVFTNQNSIQSNNQPSVMNIQPYMSMQRQMNCTGR